MTCVRHSKKPYREFSILDFDRGVPCALCGQRVMIPAVFKYLYIVALFILGCAGLLLRDTVTASAREYSLYTYASIVTLILIARPCGYLIYLIAYHRNKNGQENG